MHGLLQSQGDEHKEQRRFALRHLKDFGFGKSSLDEIINDEVKDLVEEMRANAEKGLDIAPDQVGPSSNP